jgi:hypothetical protein
MQFDRDEYMLLSRGGRAPRSSRERRPAQYLVEDARRSRAGRPAPRRRRPVARRLLSAISQAGGRAGRARPDHHRN